MEEKKIYYYTSETMRSIIDSMNSHRISKLDVINIFHDGQNYVVVYEM